MTSAARSGEDSWVTPEQYRGIQVGLRIVNAWAGAGSGPEAALHRALMRERDPGDIVIGLATVARLLAIDLAAATGRSEAAVLGQLGDTVARLQHPAGAAAR